MSLIEDEEKARKFASAIISDVSLYHSDRIAHSMDPERDLAEPLEEARQLYQSRDAPPFYMIFEDAVHKWAAEARARATPAAPTSTSADRDPIAGGIEDWERRHRDPSGGSGWLVPVIVVIAVLGLSFAIFAHERHHDAPDKHEGSHH